MLRSGDNHLKILTLVLSFSFFLSVCIFHYWQSTSKYEKADWKMKVTYINIGVHLVRWNRCFFGSHRVDGEYEVLDKLTRNQRVLFSRCEWISSRFRERRNEKEGKRVERREQEEREESEERREESGERKEVKEAGLGADSSRITLIGSVPSSFYSLHLHLFHFFSPSIPLFSSPSLLTLLLSLFRFHVSMIPLIPSVRDNL